VQLPGATRGMTQLDAASCYRALGARDARFDGVFVVALTMTGVYCRPICPARTPGASRCARIAGSPPSIGVGRIVVSESTHIGVKATVSPAPTTP
jgi:hypothetical protein